MKILNIGAVVLLILCCQTYAFAQTDNVPVIGKKFPEFSFQNVQYFKEKNVTLETFQGKWLLLDLWSLACRSCVNNISEMNSLNLAFRNEIGILLVGSNDKEYNKGVEEFYSRLRKKKSLQLPLVYDSTLLKKWAVGSVPNIYIIDPNGILRYITDGRDITVEKLKSLMKGNPVNFFEVDAKRPKFVFAENGIPSQSDKIIYTSFITKWNNENQNSGSEIDRFVTFPIKERINGWSLAAVPLYALYNYAYHGRWYWLPEDTAFYAKTAHYPILEIVDSSLFEYSFDENLGLGLYNYYLKLPVEKMTQASVMNAIQESLKTTFGYEVSVENRSMPIWKLEATKAAITTLRTKGGKPICDYSNTVNGFTLRNCSVKSLLWLIGYHLPDKNEVPLIDETGIIGNIDIKMDCLMPDRESVTKALHAQGLTLKRGTKEMKVIVIRDALKARK